MTTRPRTTCLILSALLFSSCSVLSSDSFQRTVRVRALADVSFRERNPSWSDEARDLIESASDYYEREFDIRLVAQTVAAWPEKERVHSTPELLARAQQTFSASARDDYDVTVIFTAERISPVLRAGRPRVDRIGNCDQGLGSYAIVPITRIFHYRGATSEPEIDVIALVHEIGHIFGAQHVNDTNSIMNEEFGYRTEFDAQNRAVIKKNRSCPFAK